MAVSVNTVYQRVLAIANKEQRGYITPQEFNLFANQAQMDIFEQYFYDINQFNRAPGNDTEYSNMLDLLNEKIATFQKYKQDISVSGASIVGLGEVSTNKSNTRETLLYKINKNNNRTLSINISIFK